MTEGEVSDAAGRIGKRQAQCQAPPPGNDPARDRALARAAPKRSRSALSQTTRSERICFGFYCAPARLVIEVDGEAHDRGDRPARDAVRDTWLVSQGLRVLRYPAIDVLSKLDEVVLQIRTIALDRRERF